jgi:hypothetical protein
MTDFIYGFVLAEAEAEKLDQGVDAPAGLHRVTIPQGDGNVRHMRACSISASSCITSTSLVLCDIVFVESTD